VRYNNITKAYKPRVTAWKKKTVHDIVVAHKRAVRHAAKQYLQTGHRHHLDRMFRKLTNWDFD
jgi:hypothetical protein